MCRAQLLMVSGFRRPGVDRILSGFRLCLQHLIHVVLHLASADWKFGELFGCAVTCSFETAWSLGTTPG